MHRGTMDSFAVEQLRHVVNVKNKIIERLLERPQEAEVNALQTQLKVRRRPFFLPGWAVPHSQFSPNGS